MKTLKFTQSYYPRDLPSVSSIKPYFFPSRTRKMSLNASIGTQCEKYSHKRSISEGLSKSPITILNSIVMKKILSRPTSPITIPTKSLDYIPSSKIRKKKSLTKSSRLHYQFLHKIVKKVQSPSICKASMYMPNKSITKNSQNPKFLRKTIKLSHSPVLNDCPSNASIDYFLPRYKS